jgi:GNAT superfamily N-acetyltransferase
VCHHQQGAPAPAIDLPSENAAVCDEWMPLLQLRLTPAQFRQLPRHAAYRYDFLDGEAWINPRPRYYHALLDLDGLALEGAAALEPRPLHPADWEELVEVFATAFRNQQPFAGLDEETRRGAARRSLEQTRDGGDGPWVEAASFVAADAEGRPIGAILITLLPEHDPTDWDAYHWSSPPPPDCVARCLGRPHLTWVFVHPERAGRGVGTALLGAAAAALRGRGYTSLLSTFLAGNDSSMLWHWRAGFRLLTHPGSRRRRP